MTQYTHRITLAVPAAYIEQANHIALIMGESPADIGTFKQADWQDSDGNLYAICSAVSKPVVLGAVTGGLPDPLPSHAEEADVTKAQQALGLLKLYEDGVLVSPDHIVLAVDYEPLGVLESMGLTRVVDENI